MSFRYLNISFHSLPACKVSAEKSADNEQKKAGVTILISDKVDFKAKQMKKDKAGQYIMIKGTLHQEDITLINIYAPNTEAPKFVKQL